MAKSKTKTKSPEKKSPETPSTLEWKDVLAALRRAQKGDFSSRLPMDLTGVEGEVALAFNSLVERNEHLTRELTTISQTVGVEGKISKRLTLSGAEGDWSKCVESVNELITDLTWPTQEIARVIGAVAKGDLSQSIQTDQEGRPLKGE